MLATVRAARVADELDDPAWSGVVAFMRGASSGAVHRPQQYRWSVAAADALRSHLDDRRAVGMCGMCGCCTSTPLSPAPRSTAPRTP
jgi:hypothetical protein